MAHPLGHNDALPAVSADVTCWRSTEYCQNHSRSSNVTVGPRAGPQAPARRPCRAPPLIKYRRSRLPVIYRNVA
jgi:hypothetical protein